MNFTQAIASGFRNYVTFSGRAARSEFWYWALFVVILSVVAAILDAAVFPELWVDPENIVTPFGSVASLATLLPSLAVGARRLHDIDRTAWWLLLHLTLIGTFVIIYWACCKGTSGPNRFGPDPL